MRIHNAVSMYKLGRNKKAQEINMIMEHDSEYRDIQLHDATMFVFWLKRTKSI